MRRSFLITQMQLSPRDRISGQSESDKSLANFTCRSISLTEIKSSYGSKTRISSAGGSAFEFG